MTSYEPPVYMSDDEEGGPSSYSSFQEIVGRYSGYRDEGSQEEDIAISVDHHFTTCILYSEW